MAVATLPPSIEIDGATKKAVIGGLKTVLATLQKSGRFDGSYTYQGLISDPAVLVAFIEVFRANRAEVDDLVRPASGGEPVRDDSAPLECGISLLQIQQLLVRTAARRQFDSNQVLETVTETITRKSLFGLIRKTETVERQTPDPLEERKSRELLPLIAYPWQLSLLDAYRAHLTYQHLCEIGPDLLALDTVGKIEAVSRFEPAVIRKVKLATGDDFGAILADRPEAIAGIAVWNRDMYEFYRRTLGDRAWAFFARDSAFFNVCASLDKVVAKIFGDVLCYIAAENLLEIQRLNIDKIEVIVHALRTAFGDQLPQILSQPTFARDILRKVVDSLLHLNQEKDKLMISFAISLKSNAPAIEEWLASTKAG